MCSDHVTRTSWIYEQNRRPRGKRGKRVAGTDYLIMDLHLTNKGVTRKATAGLSLKAVVRSINCNFLYKGDVTGSTKDYCRVKQ